MIKAWKFSIEKIAVVVKDEPATEKLLSESGFEDHCLTDHESQFHVSVCDLHKFAKVLGLNRSAQNALLRSCPGSDLLITIDRTETRQTEHFAEVEFAEVARA